MVACKEYEVNTYFHGKNKSAGVGTKRNLQSDPYCPRKSSTGSQKHNGKLRSKQDVEGQADCFPALKH